MWFFAAAGAPALAAESAKNEVERLDPPANKERLKKARETVVKMFATDFDQATTAANKRKLAQELLENVPRIKDDVEVRFAMLTEARNLAIGSSRVALVGESIDLTAKYFRVDAMEMKISALEELSKAARDSSVHREIAVAALDLSKTATRDERFNDAERLVLLALLSARKIHSSQLIRDANAMNLEIAAVKKKAKK